MNLADLIVNTRIKSTLNINTYSPCFDYTIGMKKMCHLISMFISRESLLSLVSLTNIMSGYMQDYRGTIAIYLHFFEG